MKVLDIEQNTPEWIEARKCRIMGSKLKDIYSTRLYTKEDVMRTLSLREVEFSKYDSKDKLEALLTDEDKMTLQMSGPKKLAFYQLIADRLAIEEDGDEEPIDRGHRLEEEAAKLFSETYDKKVEHAGIWVRDDNDYIAISPDRAISSKGLVTEALEIKCLGSAYHIKAYIENGIPDDYHLQVLQYFITNDDLEKLYFVMYDPRFKTLPFICFEVDRKEVADEVEFYRLYEENVIKEVNKIVERLAF